MSKKPIDRLLDVCVERPLTKYESQALQGYIAALRQKANGHEPQSHSQNSSLRVYELEKQLADCREVIRKYDLNKYMD